MKKPRMKISIITLIMTLLSFVNVYAQEQLSISGIVKDINNEPLISATVLVKGSIQATLTDMEGRYVIKASPSAILVFTYTGYDSQEIRVSNRTVINTVMQETAKNLDEVVVVGYGVQKKVNLTGSVESIKGDVISKRTSGQLSSMLQGLTPGLTVTQTSGQPGRDMGALTIRGAGSFGGVSPLIIVDGVEGDMNSIDPNLIETISVLKDAASSAIYGVRGANGVILVTTKRAKEGKFKVAYNGYLGTQEPTNLPKTVNAYEHMIYMNEAYKNTGKTPLYNDVYLEQYRDSMGVSNNISLFPNTNWKDELLRGSGLQQNHFVTISGSTGNIKLVASGGYFNQEGLIANTNYKRYTFRMSADADISSRLSSRIDAQVIHGKILEPTTPMSTIFRTIASYPSNYVVRNTNGTWGEGWNGQNPVAEAEEGGTTQDSKTYFTMNLGFNYKLFDGLVAEAVYSPSFTPQYIHRFSNQAQKYNGNGQALTKEKSSLTETSQRTFANTFKALLRYEKTFGNHHLSGLGGFQQEYIRFDFLSAFRDDFVNPQYEVIDGGMLDKQSNNGRAWESAMQSYFARVNYNFSNRYLFEANLRTDGTSRFAQNNRWGFFPSLSAGWRITEEEFMKNYLETISNMKLRASWGMLGNQGVSGVLESSANYPFTSIIDHKSSYVFNDKQYLGSAMYVMANKELQWEKTSMIDVGLDLQLFSKLNVTFDWFYKKTTDVIYIKPIPMTLGLQSPSQNAGTLENRGWDLSMNYHDKIGSDFQYDVTLALSDVKNKVLEFKGQTTGLIRVVEGYPIDAIWGYESGGLFSSKEEIANSAVQPGNIAPGDIRYVNQNSDNNITAEDEKVIGNTQPRYTYSAGFNFAYKGLDLSLFWQGVGKRDGYITTYGIVPFFNGSTIQYQHLDRYTDENKNVNAQFPRFTFGETNNQRNSSFWIKDASYLRLKNVQLGYTIPSNLIKKLSIERLRFNVSAQNLMTFDNFWEGFDVEAPVSDGGFYPQVKTFTFGIDITF